ncbi:MAG TPA: acyl-CoA thioesterase domain-containing protein [Candidatus Limnocylindrales bacterium]|nr:acyl-CoA thioesterase domain-containing protein [Candidatus Limnocylindrales bacterium]
MIEAAKRLAAAIEAAPYAARLGFRAGGISDAAANGSVPYAGVLANAQGFIHGGVAASLSIWSALVAAVASDRGPAGDLDGPQAIPAASPVSLSISYLAPARAELLRASAAVVSRGREIAHVRIDVAGKDANAVATALVVLRTTRPPAAATAPSMGEETPFPEEIAGFGDAAERSRPLISPFSQAMGMIVHSYDSNSAVLAMRRDINSGPTGAVDWGALAAMADTCAALACLPSIDERMLGSATLSLSAIFGEPLLAPAIAVGRPVAESGELKSALVEVGAGNLDAAEKIAGRPAMTACVAYRFVAARDRS